MFKKIFVYLGVGLIWSIVQNLLVQQQDLWSFAILWLIGTLFLALARLLDNYCDYEKDRRAKKRKTHFTKKQLVALAFVCAGIIIVMSVARYGYIGFCSLLGVGLLIIYQQIDWLKVFTLAVISTLYLVCLSGGDFTVLAQPAVLIYIGLEIICALAFVAMKTKRRKR